MSRLVVCPDCCAVISVTNPANCECPFCEQEMGWLLQIDSVTSAMSQYAHKHAVLHVGTISLDGEHEFEYSGEDSFQISNGNNRLCTVKWFRTRNCVFVLWGEHQTEFELPCKFHRDGTTIQIKAKVAIRNDDEPMPLGRGAAEATSIPRGAPFTIGRDAQDVNNLCAVDQAVELQHCLFARHPNRGRETWLFDLESRSGTFVNGQSIVAQRLESGDLIQVGPFGWQYSASDGFLVPVGPIVGCQVEVCDLIVRQQLGLDEIRRRLAGFKKLPQLIVKLNRSVLNTLAKSIVGPPPVRLGPVSFCANAGEFVAIVGESGSGKSSLVRAIVSGRSGNILVNGLDTSKRREFLRQSLGYVSQKRVVHNRLTCLQAVTYSAKFRERQLGLKTMQPFAVENRLREVGLPGTRWNAKLTRISGGQLSRLQTAAEIINDPGLFVLDEPVSSLDDSWKLEILRLLKTISLRGGTVLVVIHDVSHLHLFDRILELKDGKLIYDGPPTEWKACGDREPSSVEKHSIRQITNEAGAKRLSKSQPFHETSNGSKIRPPGLLQKFVTHFSREVHLVLGDWVWRCGLPLLAVPILFALAIAFAVPASELSKLGFLCVLSVIWMSASLSLLAIVDERVIVEHERLMFLNIFPYLSSKMAVLWGFSLIQTIIFFMVLFGVWRLLIATGQSNDYFLLNPQWSLAWLVLVGWAGVGLGIFISAVSGFSRATANFVLPVVMIAQIVFSVQIAGNADADLAVAYGEFSPTMCQAHKECRRQAQFWRPTSDTPQWICDRCLRREASNEPPGAFHASTVQDLSANKDRPNWLAAALSYWTISRYGDIALRSFAYTKPDSEPYGHEATSPYSTAATWFWQMSSLVALSTFAIGLPILAGLFLRIWPRDYESATS